MEVLLQGVQATGRIGVSNGLEGRLPLELEEHGDLLEDADDIFF